MTTTMIFTIIWAILFGTGCFCLYMTRIKKGSDNSRNWNLAAIILFGVSLAISITETII